MNLISGINTNPVHPLTAAEKTQGPSKAQWSENEAQSRSKAPERDAYTPEEKQEASGRYWLGKNEDGQPEVYFDNPARAANDSERQDGLPAGKPVQGQGAGGPEKGASGDKAESCTCNTDKVDREIEKLKKKQEELESQINSGTDGTKIKELEKKLAQVERELRQKDNNAYRRQHATFS